jgi:coenzyme F420-reducing hydrogenase delta subunit
VVEETLKMLKLLGADERRLHLKWISASEGALFAEEIRKFTDLMKELGPNPLAEKPSKDGEAEGAVLLAAN